LSTPVSIPGLVPADRDPRAARRYPTGQDQEVAAVSRPQVIDDEQHERVHDRVAAIDVAKDSGMVCTRTPHPSRPGARRSAVWTVKARMSAVRALGRQLARDGIEIVTLESTGVIRGAGGMNRTLPRSCRRGRVRDGKDKSGNDERVAAGSAP
jgi:hypothetical protein